MDNLGREGFVSRNITEWVLSVDKLLLLLCCWFLIIEHCTNDGYREGHLEKLHGVRGRQSIG